MNGNLETSMPDDPFSVGSPWDTWAWGKRDTMKEWDELRKGGYGNYSLSGDWNNWLKFLEEHGEPTTPIITGVEIYEH